MIRQGDILFIPTNETIPDYAKARTSGIVAQGEATGHHHRIAADDMQVAELMEIGWQGNLMLKVSEHGISIVHEEHKTVTIPPGTYKVHQAREFDYMARFARTVRD